MFWRFGGYANISTIDTILDKSDVTLEELLDEADLIQELKQHNSKLIEFLRDENVLRRLLEYVVAPKLLDDTDDNALDSIGDGAKEFSAQGAEDRLREKIRGKARELNEDEREKEEKARNKYSYMAAEVLSSDNWSLAEALMENHPHLRQFWEFMKCEPPLDPLQASYFTKVNESLLDKKT